MSPDGRSPRIADCGLAEGLARVLGGHEELIAAMALELQSGGWVVMKLDPAAAFALVGALQLVCRHPTFAGPTREFIEQLARDIQAKLGSDRPETAKACERGWDKFFDV